MYYWVSFIKCLRLWPIDWVVFVLIDWMCYLSLKVKVKCIDTDYTSRVDLDLPTVMMLLSLIVG